MSGNGVDLGTVLGAIDIVARNVNALTTRVDSLQAQMLGLAEDVRSLHGEVRGLHGEVRGLHGEVRGLQGEVQEIKREMATKDDLALLRQTVTEYHSAVIGHGILISDLDDRLRRVEQHLGLPSAG